MSSIKQKISSITKNKEAKTLAGNFMWLSLLQVAGYVFPLITMPYLARVIGVEGFGKIAFAAAIMVWIQTIADWGFNLTATRDVAQNRDNPQKVSEIFSNVLWARCALMLLSFIVLVLLIFIVPKFRENCSIILVTFLMIPGHIFFPDWFFQAIEKMKYITILNVLMKLIFTIAVFIFIKQPEDYILQPLFTSLGYVVSGLIALYYIVYKWDIKIHKPNGRGVLQTIKRSTDVFINNLAPNLYNSFSTVLLGFFGGGIANGIYDGGVRFFNIGSQLLHIFTRTFFPFLSRRPEKHNQFTTITIGVTVVMAVILYVGAPWLVEFILSPEFADSVIVLRILAVSLIFVTLSSVYGSCYLIIHNQERLLRKITVYSSLSGFIIAWPLIYYFSYIGVALTVAFSRFLLGAFTMYFAKRDMNQNKVK
jgi:PST family polysaccharide transporter